MLQAILNKSWWQHPTRHQLYGHLSPITQTIQVIRTRYGRHCWRSRDALISDVLLWTPTYVRIWDVAQKTCQRWWMIGRSGERGSGISVLAAWHDDDDIKDLAKCVYNISSLILSRTNIVWFGSMVYKCLLGYLMLKSGPFFSFNYSFKWLYSNLWSSFLRCGTRPNEWGTL